MNKIIKLSFTKAALAASLILFAFLASAQSTITLTTGSCEVHLTNGQTLTGTGGCKTHVTIADGATVTLSGVNITNMGLECAWPGISCEGDATIILDDNTFNIVQGGYLREYYGRYPGIYIPKNKTLTIQGSGAINATCALNAPGTVSGVGIGGINEDGYRDCGNIVVRSGIITATGAGSGAGIGGAPSGACGNITIENDVTFLKVTKGNDSPNFIGASKNGTCGTVSVFGNSGAISESPYIHYTNTATFSIKFDKNASDAVGTMSDMTSLAYNVNHTLSNCQFTRSGYKFVGWKTTSAFDGIIDYENQATICNMPSSVTLYAMWVKNTDTFITPSTGEITLTDGAVLIGIGGKDTHIKIADNATVTLNNVAMMYAGNNSQKKPKYYAGLSCLGNATIILADGSNNTFMGGSSAFPGVFVPSDKTLKIEGVSGTLNAFGNKVGAGIGGGGVDDAGNISIYGGVINAIGGKNGAGIGSSGEASSHSCGNISIYGGNITAIGGSNSAGIGSGDYANCGDITMVNGIVTVVKGENAKNTIGLGNNGTCGTVKIGEEEGSITESPYHKELGSQPSFTVIFNAGVSTGIVGSMNSQDIYCGIFTPLSKVGFSRDGYVFKGWSTSSDGDAIMYTDGQNVKDLATANGSVTLYAKWIPDYGLSVDPDYSEGQTEFYYANMAYPATYVNIDDTKYFPFKIYDDGGKNGDIIRTQGEQSVIITAPEGYKISIDGSVKYYGTFIIYDGLTNYLTSTYGGGPVTVSGRTMKITLVANYYPQPYDDRFGANLTATISPIDYSITYIVTDGATFATDNPTLYTVISDAFTLENPTKEGYEFVGWAIDEQTTPTKTITLPKGSTGNKVFTTVFKKELGDLLTLYYYGNRIIAEIQGDFTTSSEGKSLAISTPQTVDKVIFKRSFKAGISATIMLPFGFTPNNKIGNFYTLASVAPDKNGVWTATMSNPVTYVEANKPYIFKSAVEELNEMSFEDKNGITLQSTSTIEINPNGDWTLHGVYEKTMLYGNGQINYGFAGKDVTADGISVGDFIRAGEGVWADPMRCYLTYKKGELTKAATVLPDRIRVVFPDEVNSNNETTDIIENTETEDVVTPVSEFTPENGVKVWSFDGTVYIEAQPDMDYTIVDLTGRTIKKGVTHSTHEEINLNAKGIVIVKIGNKTFKLK